MNVITGKKPLAQISGFNGLYNRGLSETCPADHLNACYNCIFPGRSQLSIREPVTISSGPPVSVLSATTILSYFIANVAGGAALLTLNSDGKFYDETHGTLLGTFVGADDFVAVNLFGRTYISFTANGRAYTFGTLMCYYYSAVAVAYVLRTVNTAPPVTAPTLTQPLAGNVDPGNHNFAVSFINENGTLSIPSPITTINSTGANNVRVSNIPIGGSPIGAFGGPAIVGRIILATKANQEELFFIPGGTINDNVTTTADLNFFDTSLISSADYLNDLIESVPSCTSLRFYKGRMVIVGQRTAPDQILLSDQLFPESFNAITGVVNMPVDYGINNCNTAAVIRDTLYVLKPNGTYATQDNGLTPSEWPVSNIDSGIGAFDTGLSLFASAMSGQDVYDSCLVVHKSGLHVFNGSYSDIPLTYKIQGIWDLIDPNNFWRVQIAHDNWQKRVYLAIPLSKPAALGGEMIQSVDNKNHIILMMDYQEGMTPQTVKWSAWYTNVADPILKMTMENFTLSYTGTPQMIFQLSFCCGVAQIFKIVFDPTTPYLADVKPAGYEPIEQYFISSAIPPVGSGQYTFVMLDFSVEGNGTFDIRVYNKNRSAFVSYNGFNLSSYSGQNLQRGINFVHEGIQLQVHANTIVAGTLTASFKINAIDVYGTLMWPMRPALTEAL